MMSLPFSIFSKTEGTAKADPWKSKTLMYSLSKIPAGMRVLILYMPWTSDYLIN